MNKVFILTQAPYYDGGTQILGVYSDDTKAVMAAYSHMAELQGWEGVEQNRRWENDDYEFVLAIEEHEVK